MGKKSAVLAQRGGCAIRENCKEAVGSPARKTVSPANKRFIINTAYQ
jgi:hypothetical protein